MEEERIIQLARESTGAADAAVSGTIQSLWSGYGEIVRVALRGARVPSVVVKRVSPPRRGADRSHQRKLASYAVERRWYASWAHRCGEGCRIPRCFAAEEEPSGWVFVLEDLDASGYAGRTRRPGADALAACLGWLASFHATFLGVEPEGLWPRGTYWHLATRPDELARIADPGLRAAAHRIDAALADARHRTLVHGDAKAANFCFGRDAVAAVDFQYVGGGVGVQDLAYLLGGCLTSAELLARADGPVDAYFDALRRALPRDVDASAVEAEWRALLPFAWADFHRFLAGWAPDAHRDDRYAERITRAVIEELGTS